MRIEEIIGHRIAQERNRQGITQAQLGQMVAEYLGRPWPRQAVSVGEKGDRAFTAAELVAFSLTLKMPLDWLLTPPEGMEEITLPGGRTVNYEALAIDPLPGISPGQAISDVDDVLGDAADKLTQRAILEDSVVSVVSQLQDAIDRARAAIKEDRQG